MTATDELRRMLDERGVEYFKHEDGEPLRKLEKADEPATSWRMGGASVCAVPIEDSELFDLWIDHCTPEQAVAATLGSEISGDTSDGYHTFDELYYHRTALFACLVALQPRQMAFKSWKHSDGTMYEGMFIAGIYTSRGWCTYHCEAKWWPLFDCSERELAPEWDGHTPSDAIHRLMTDFLPEQEVRGEAAE